MAFWVDTRLLQKHDPVIPNEAEAQGQVSFLGGEVGLAGEEDGLFCALVAGIEEGGGDDAARITAPAQLRRSPDATDLDGFGDGRQARAPVERVRPAAGSRSAGRGAASIGGS